MTGTLEDQDLEGSTLCGKYRIEGLIGRGGMGTVWAAEHIRTGRRLAIKVLSRRFLDHKGVVERFGREARAAGSIQHPGIVEVLDIDRSDSGLPFLVMERLAGETLAQRLDRLDQLSSKQVIVIAKQLLEALDAAHRHGVVHRDLKPDNVHLVPRAGGGETVKILDFGISAKEDERVSGLTQDGAVLGTPHYMAPEQALGEAQLDGRADLYALGVLMYECLVGDIPFDAPNYNRLIYVILNDAPVPPSTSVKNLHPELEAFVLRLLKKKPENRFPDARSAKEELERVERSVRAPKRKPSVEDFKLDIPVAPSRSSRRNSSAPIPVPVNVQARGLDDDPFSDALTGPGDLQASLELDEAALARPSKPLPAVSPAERVSSSPPGGGIFSSHPPLPARQSYRPIAVSGYPAKSTRPPDRSSHGLLVLLLLAAGGAIAWFFWLRTPPPPEPVAPTATVPSTVRSPVDDGTVRVELRHLPVGARLRLDGLPTGDPPLRLRRDGQSHVLEIRAPGYESRRIEFEASGDLALSGSLRPQAGVGR